MVHVFRQFSLPQLFLSGFELHGDHASVNKENQKGQTPLFYAVSEGNIDMAKSLINKGAFIDKQNHEGETPLFYAACYGLFEMLTFLISKGASINIENVAAETPLFYAVWSGYNKETEYLINRGALCNKKNNRGETPLMYAAKNEDVEVLKVLINKDALIDSEDQNGDTPLAHALSSKNEEACKILLKRGASFKKALEIAVLRGEYETVEFLFDHTQCINIEESYREKLLISAAEHGHTEICEFFISYGMCASKEDHIKLYQAAGCEKTKICKILVEYGADITDIVEDEMKENILRWKEAFGKQ